jgi:hypothetical protein
MHTDRLHDHGEHKEWNESFYFNFYDRLNDICGFMRIGLKPNKDERMMFCFLMMPDGTLVGKRGRGPYAAELMQDGLTYTMMEPEALWSLRFQGMMGQVTSEGPIPIETDMDLGFRSLNPIFDYRRCVNAEEEAISQSVASEHLEQFGKITGTLRIGDQTYEVDALGERDHSWGPREWTTPKMWIWLTSEFSDEMALNVTKLDMGFAQVDAGFVHVNGSDKAIISADIDTEYGDDGAPAALCMSLHDEHGDVHKVEARVMRVARMPFNEGNTSSIMYETLAEYEFRGQKGYGIAEYLIRSR